MSTPSQRIEPQVHEAFEVVVGAEGAARVVLTCEHASNRMPDPWAWPAEDQWIVDTHWAVDIGAADLTRALAENLGAVAVLARYSRLLIDPNRALTASSLFREMADGKPILVNRDVDDSDARRRIDDYWHPYHEVLTGVIEARPGAGVLAMHSFTPVYEGSVREMEVGVLFDRDDALAHRIAASLEGAGLKVALNQPYSGRNGMMYSAYRHAVEHGRSALELEVRQDLCGDAAQRPRLVQAIAGAVRDAGMLGD